MNKNLQTVQYEAFTGACKSTLTWDDEACLLIGRRVITKPTSFHRLLKQMYRWLFSAKMYSFLLKSSDCVVSFSVT